MKKIINYSHPETKSSGLEKANYNKMFYYREIAINGQHYNNNITHYQLCLYP